MEQIALLELLMMKGIVVQGCQHVRALALDCPIDFDRFPVDQTRFLSWLILGLTVAVWVALN